MNSSNSGGGNRPGPMFPGQARVTRQQLNAPQMAMAASLTSAARMALAESEEARTIAERIAAQARRACTPLVFAKEQGDHVAMPFEIGRNGERKVVMHFFRRPDVEKEAGSKVVGLALDAIIGKPLPSMPRDKKTGLLLDVFYRDEKEIQIANSLPRRLLESDSWYIEIPADASSVLPPSDFLRNKFAIQLQDLWSKHGRLKTTSDSKPILIK